MPFYLVWTEEIIVLIIGLVCLGVALHLVTKSNDVRGGQSVIGRPAALIVFAGIVVFSLTRSWFFTELPLATWRNSIPLAAASLAVILYATIGVRPRPVVPSREIDLAPRTMWSFGSRWWFAGWVTFVGLLSATVVLAGLASSTDGEGGHTMIVLDVGSSQAGTTFFGWAFGVPVLLFLAVLSVVDCFALSRIARPAVPADPVERSLEVAIRRNQVRTVLALSVGAIAFTFGAALIFISRAATLSASVLGSDGVRVELGTSFAALQIPLTVSGLLLQGLGVALVALPVFQRSAKTAGNTRSTERTLDAAQRTMA
ncbi:hypothetical protein [Mycetocola zhujimingii]|uniref:hypothetical protein n=1 Tax=Mycetocola zhujimingii TaxID=2079792 RepID=UPI000D362C01|nr:hypothetical protein [Mycetocola zhujimingii]AWB86072.1 hypothetical protein C3E77_05215 [Mycetocola zhujimingii]